MKIDNEFTVDAPIERAWAVLTDLETIAPCMPGARLTGVDGDVYSGKVRVKVGPVVAQYSGTVKFREKDDSTYEAVIDASGRDSRGAGTASAAITAKMREDGGRTTVTVDTDLKISGKLAQFGRGMIQEVSGKLLAQFVDCLQGKLAEDGEETAGEAPGAAAASTPAADQAAGAPAAAESTESTASTRTDTEPAALDLMSVAGGSLYKRLIPVVVVVAVIVVAVLVYLAVS